MTGKFEHQWNTALDMGVLIAAIRGEPEIAVGGLEILDDPLRRFASSPFIKLELVPKATFYGKREELEFYEEYFSNVRCWATVNDDLMAPRVAKRASLG